MVTAPRDEPTPGDDTARRWALVKTTLADCLELSGERRAAFLARLQDRDPVLAGEVRELAAADDTDAPFLEPLPDALIEDVMIDRADRRIVGRRLGAYRVVRRIGRGGMGDVYLGERADGAFEMQVAIKLLREGLPADADISRFERERQILASLEHVNLAKIVDGGVTETGMPYFVMELVDGLPIDEYCRRTAATTRDRVALLRSVCRVVHYVNQRGVVHRDLKPRNILVTAQGVVKLLDFGVAARLDDARGGASEPTRTAMRSMTLLYSSPEQIRGDVVGAASDVYALGVVMFGLLAGRSPYPLDAARTSSFELAHVICEVEPHRLADGADGADRAPAARARRRELRGDLDAIVAKALRKDPAARYASAGDLDDDLFRHQSGVPVRARRGAFGYRLGRWLMKHRTFAVAAIVANLALAAGLTVSLQQAHEARLQRERAQQSLASVRSLANVFLFDVDDAVAALPGAIGVRRLLVDKAQRYLATLAAAADADPALKLELAVSYRKIGDIQGHPNQPNLGDVAGALASYDRAIALLQPLVASERADAAPRSTAPQLELSRAWSRKATTLSYQGDFDAAQAAARASRTNAEDVLHDEPGNAAAKLLQASAYGLISWAGHEVGDTAGFELNALISEKLLGDIVAAHPEDREANRNLQSFYARRGVATLDRDPSAETARLALEALEKWARLADGMVALAPGNPAYRGSAAEAYSFEGLALQRMDEPVRAIAALDRSVELLRQELKLAPQDDSAAYLMMNTRVALARILLAQGNPAAAREQALGAIAAYDARPEPVRGSVLDLHSAAQAHFQAGRAWMAQAGAPSTKAPVRADDRRQGCREFHVSLALLHRMPSLPRSSSDTLSIEDVRGAAKDCGADAGNAR